MSTPTLCSNKICGIHVFALIYVYNEKIISPFPYPAKRAGHWDHAGVKTSGSLNLMLIYRKCIGFTHKSPAQAYYLPVLFVYFNFIAIMTPVKLVGCDNMRVFVGWPVAGRPDCFLHVVQLYIICIGLEVGFVPTHVYIVCIYFMYSWILIL